MMHVWIKVNSLFLYLKAYQTSHFFIIIIFEIDSLSFCSLIYIMRIIITRTISFHHRIISWWWWWRIWIHPYFFFCCVHHILLLYIPSISIMIILLLYSLHSSLAQNICTGVNIYAFIVSDVCCTALKTSFINTEYCILDTLEKNHFF